MFQCILVDGYKWKGVGGVQEAEIEKRGAERRIPRAVGSGRNREKLCNTAQYLQLRKHKEAGANKNRMRTVIKG